MTNKKSVKYQDEKIRYHTKMAGYYEDMENRDDIGGSLGKEAIQELLSYHKKLAVYHKKRHDLIKSGLKRG